MPPIRVAHVPGSHPYAVHLSSERTSGAPAVVIVPDVIPADRPVGQWWPPVMFTADWIRMNAAEFDILHLHFGFESFTAEELEATLAALADVDRPLVFTVHDLLNPQLRYHEHHERALDLLVPAADALITLTAGAAREIEDRWGRAAAVIPHPHVIDWETAPLPTAPRSGSPIVAMHLKDLRPNIDAVRATATLIGSVEALRSKGIDIRAEIHLSERVRDEDARRLVREASDRSDAVSLLEHRRFTDDELSASLVAVDACVLPYRHGTHSGWLELCFDLGVPVVAPAIGYYADQHAESGAITLFEPGSTPSLAQALETALASVHPSPDDRRALRRDQREDIARAHLLVYTGAMAARLPTPVRG